MPHDLSAVGVTLSKDGEAVTEMHLNATALVVRPRARHWREASQGAIRVWFAHPSLDLLPAALIVAIQPSTTGREGPAVTAAPVIAAVGWSVLAPLVLRLDRPMLGFPHGFPTTVYMNFLRLWAVGVLIALLATAGAVWGPTRVGGAAAVVGLTSMTRVSILGWYLARLTRRRRPEVFQSLPQHRR